MSVPRSATDVLDREYLEMRAKILELAACLDRLDRAHSSVADDRRMQLIREGLYILGDSGPDRAEQVQLAFSRPYDDAWQKSFGM